jgi:hypothetical protein
VAESASASCGDAVAGVGAAVIQERAVAPKHDACPSPAGPQHTRAMHAAGRPGRRTGARGPAPFPPRRSGRRRPRRSDRPRSQSAPPLWGFLKKRGCQGRGVQRGGARRGKRRPKRACTRVRKGPGAVRGAMPAPRRAPWFCARSPRWRARAVVAAFPDAATMPWRPMRAQVDRRFLPDGTCERGAAAWERLPCGAAFSDGVVRACARQGACARDGARAKIAALGACTMERTGPCQRERGAGRRSCARTRARARARTRTR